VLAEGEEYRLATNQEGNTMRPINDQVVVITGASSGIGRETALQFGQRGASVVLAARNLVALDEVARQVRDGGGQAHVLVADVGEWEQVRHLAEEAVARFGRIDTWVNNAGVTEYATVEDTTAEELNRIIQVNLLGQIYGVKAALPYMKRAGAGTIINVASGLGMRAVPWQSAYCASKHGIKGFTESLRLELAHQQSGIVVTTILPSSMNTPLFRHARSKIGVKPLPFPPVYDPRAVAEAIVFATEHPRREIYVGAAGKVLSVLEGWNPGLVDRMFLAGNSVFKLQQTGAPDDGQDNLFMPMDAQGAIRGEFGDRAQPTSLYTRLLDLYPNRKRLLLTACTLGLVALIRRAGR
jgi:NAD(P)-dependent dehydrogenase (short-subunit alcohol dehydrogenase family)